VGQVRSAEPSTPGGRVEGPSHPARADTASADGAPVDPAAAEFGSGARPRYDGPVTADIVPTDRLSRRGLPAAGRRHPQRHGGAAVDVAEVHVDRSRTSATRATWRQASRVPVIISGSRAPTSSERENASGGAPGAQGDPGRDSTRHRARSGRSDIRARVRDAETQPWRWRSAEAWRGVVFCAIRAARDSHVASARS